MNNELNLPNINIPGYVKYVVMLIIPFLLFASSAFVIIDAGSVGDGLDFSRLEARLEGLVCHDATAPEEVVPATLWLAQQDASTFTGHLVHRDEFGSTWP